MFISLSLCLVACLTIISSCKENFFKESSIDRLLPVAITYDGMKNGCPIKEIITKYGDPKRLKKAFEKNRQLIDSLMQEGPTPKITSEKLVKEANKHLDSKERKKAMPLFNLAYLVDSTNAKTYLGFGRILKPMHPPLYCYDNPPQPKTSNKRFEKIIDACLHQSCGLTDYPL